MSSFQLEWNIDENGAGKLIRDFLLEKEISKAALTDIKFAGGKILLNGEEVTVRKCLSEGDRLTISFPLEESTVEGENIPLSIIYEDPYILVVNKPQQMNTIPSREHPTGSLANGVMGYYEKQGIKSTVHVVTRLDRDTSGLVLIAKYRHIHHLFSKMQKEGLVKRSYEAFAEGKFAEEFGVIEKPIGRKGSSIIEREVRDDGQYALTRYKVIQQYEDFAHVQLELETGRTHQIRVHLAYIGHPLVGDDLYGGQRKYMDRQALHCSKISFVHPVNGEKLAFYIPLPDDMARLIL